MSARERLGDWLDLRGRLRDAHHGEVYLPRGWALTSAGRRGELMRHAFELGKAVGERDTCERYSIPVAPPPKKPRTRHLSAV